MDVFKDATFTGLIRESRSIIQEPDRTLPLLSSVIILIGQLQSFTLLAFLESIKKPQLLQEEQEFFEGLLEHVLPNFELVSEHLAEARSHIELIRTNIRGVLGLHGKASVE